MQPGEPFALNRMMKITDETEVYRALLLGPDCIDKRPRQPEQVRGLCLGDAFPGQRFDARCVRENQVAGLQATSVVSTGYGNAAQPLAKLGVLGPTRMDYPGAMGAVRAVARYVGQILMES